MPRTRTLRATLAASVIAMATLVAAEPEIRLRIEPGDGWWCSTGGMFCARDATTACVAAPQTRPGQRQVTPDNRRPCTYVDTAYCFGLEASVDRGAFALCADRLSVCEANLSSWRAALSRHSPQPTFLPCRLVR